MGGDYWFKAHLGGDPVRPVPQADGGPQGGPGVFGGGAGSVVLPVSVSVVLEQIVLGVAGGATFDFIKLRESQAMDYLIYANCERRGTTGHRLIQA